MPFDEAHDYYEGRRQSAVAMSQAAAAPGIRKIHLSLARRYAELAAAPDSEAPVDLPDGEGPRS